MSILMSTQQQAAPRRSKLMIVVIVAAAIVVLAVIGSAWAVVSTLRSQDEQRVYENCMARAGFAVDSRTPTSGDLDAYLDDMITAAERCRS
jgi:flagellar basal body-associated protein FliL